MVIMITSILLCWLIVNHSQDLFMGKGRLNTLHTHNLFAPLSIVVNHQSLLSSLSLSYSLSSAASYIVIIPNQSEIYILCPITLSDFNWRRENILEYSTTTNLFCKDLFLKMYFLYFAQTYFWKKNCYILRGHVLENIFVIFSEDIQGVPKKGKNRTKCGCSILRRHFLENV